MKLRTIAIMLCIASLTFGTAVSVGAAGSTTVQDTQINVSYSQKEEAVIKDILVKDKETGEEKKVDAVKSLVSLSEEAKDTFKQRMEEAGAVESVIEKTVTLVEKVTEIFKAPISVKEEGKEEKGAISFSEVVSQIVDSEGNAGITRQEFGIVENKEIHVNVKENPSGSYSNSDSDENAMKLIPVDIEHLEFKTEFLAFGAILEESGLHTVAADVTAEKGVMDQINEKGDEKRKVFAPVTLLLAYDEESGQYNDSLGFTDPHTILAQINPETGVVEYFRLSDYTECRKNEETNEMEITLKDFPYGDSLVAFIGPKEGIDIGIAEKDDLAEEQQKNGETPDRGKKN